MIRKTLLKLIDEAVVPSIFLVATKVVSTLMINRLLDLSWEFSQGRVVYFSKEDFLLANSYSSLATFLAIVLGLLWVMVKVNFFHEDHIHPRLSAKLHESNLTQIIQSTLTIYSQAAIWLIYAWLTTVILLVQAWFNLSYRWVGGVGLGVSLLATIILAIDVERDLVKEKTNERWVTRVLKLG